MSLAIRDDVRHQSLHITYLRKSPTSGPCSVVTLVHVPARSALLGNKHHRGPMLDKSYSSNISLKTPKLRRVAKGLLCHSHHINGILRKYVHGKEFR